MTIKLMSIDSNVVPVHDCMIDSSLTLVVKLMTNYHGARYVAIFSPNEWEEGVERVLGKDEYTLVERIDTERKICAETCDIRVRGREGSYWIVLPQYFCDRMPSSVELKRTEELVL